MRAALEAGRALRAPELGQLQSLCALLDAVLVANQAQIARAETMVTNSGARSIGLVGIAFKPGTDDLRESPLAELASRLIKKLSLIHISEPTRPY